MIRDARVLDADFVPREVRHRDGEVNAIEAALAPITHDERAAIPFLYGPSGSGKTCIARYLVDRLHATREVRSQYVNCWRSYSQFRALYRILEGINRAVDVHRQSTPRDELLDRLEQYDGPPYVVILDEVDQLEDKRILYDLYHNSRVAVVLIATREEALFAGVDGRVASRLSGCEHVRFRAYTEEQLRGILADRVRWGLESGVIEEEQIGRIARAAEGDARTAISALRAAARRAEQAGAEVVGDEDVAAAIPAARAAIRQGNLADLKPVQRALYEIIEEYGDLRPQALYAAYQERVRREDRVSERQVRRHLNRLAEYNLIRIHGSTRNRRYRRVEPAPQASPSP